MSTARDKKPTKRALHAVAKYATVFADPKFTAGRWSFGSSEVIWSPYFEMSRAVRDFAHAAYEITGVLRPSSQRGHHTHHVEYIEYMATVPS